MRVTESVVEVGGGEEAAGFEVAEGVLRVGEELLVEGPARPAVLHVPVHVQHEHVQRQPARLVIVDDLEDVLKMTTTLQARRRDRSRKYQHLTQLLKSNQRVHQRPRACLGTMAIGPPTLT